MKLAFVLPSGETVCAEPCQLALRNNADNSAIEMVLTRTGAEPLIVAIYAGAYLATSVVSIPPGPALLATLSPSPAPEVA